MDGILLQCILFICWAVLLLVASYKFYLKSCRISKIMIENQTKMMSDIKTIKTQQDKAFSKASSLGKEYYYDQ